MTAGFPLIYNKTGGHRPPLQYRVKKSLSYCLPIWTCVIVWLPNRRKRRSRMRMPRRLRSVWARLLGLFAPDRADRDLSDELESHLQLHVDDNIRAGMTA